MGYYTNESNVKNYIKMAEGYDGAILINELKNHLPKESTILELGMGPGKDLDILSNNYKVTGSDSSQVFLDIYSRKNKQADLLLLDAVSINTNRKFDCIYSNKVLHHLSLTELQNSFRRQSEILNDFGVIMHSFWYGDQDAEDHEGLKSYYYTETELLKIVDDTFELKELERYKEMDEGDSIYLIMRRIDG